MRNLRQITRGSVSEKNAEYLDAYFDLMTLNGSVRVFETAYTLGILKCFVDGPQSAGEVSNKLQYDLVAVELILDTLVALRLLNKAHDLYIPSPTLALLKGDYENLSADYWDHLPVLVKTGTPMKRMDEHAESEYETQVASLDWMMSPSAFLLTDLLEIGTRRKQLRILDVGAGSGVWSIPMLKKDHAASATLLDWQKVLETARVKVKDARVNARVTYLEGDLFSVDINDTYDMIIVGNVLHTLGEESCVKLLTRMREHLTKNGELVIVDVLPKDTEHQLSRILYEIGLRLRTSSGQVYELSEIKTMLSKAGYGDSQEYYMHTVPPHVMGACIVKR